MGLPALGRDIEDYNGVIDQYNKDARKYTTAGKTYNAGVSDYNEKVNVYNKKLNDINTGVGDWLYTPYLGSEYGNTKVSIPTFELMVWNPYAGRYSATGALGLGSSSKTLYWNQLGKKLPNAVKYENGKHYVNVKSAPPAPLPAFNLQPPGQPPAAPPEGPRVTISQGNKLQGKYAWADAERGGLVDDARRIK